MQVETAQEGDAVPTRRDSWDAFTRDHAASRPINGREER